MGLKILIVDDDEDNRRLLRDLLAFYKHEVMEARNGEEGLRMAIEYKPDIILMDIQMPVMNGFEAIRRLKAMPETKDIKIISITSFAMPDERERVLRSGADGYVTKPVDIMRLPEIIEKVMRG